MSVEFVDSINHSTILPGPRASVRSKPMEADDQSVIVHYIITFIHKNMTAFTENNIPTHQNHLQLVSWVYRALCLKGDISNCVNNKGFLHSFANKSQNDFSINTYCIP